MVKAWKGQFVTRKQRDEENRVVQSPQGMLGPTDGFRLASVEPGSEEQTLRKVFAEYLSSGLSQMALRSGSWVSAFIPAAHILSADSLQVPGFIHGSHALGSPATGSDLESTGPSIAPYAIPSSLAECSSDARY